MRFRATLNFDALQQTSAPPCSPRLFICVLEPLQLPTKRLVIKIFINMFAFPCLKANSVEICTYEEISSPSFFFQKNADVSIFVEIQA